MQFVSSANGVLVCERARVPSCVSELRRFGAGRARQAKTSRACQSPKSCLPHFYFRSLSREFFHAVSFAFHVPSSLSNFTPSFRTQRGGFASFDRPNTGLTSTGEHAQFYRPPSGVILGLIGATAGSLNHGSSGQPRLHSIHLAQLTTGGTTVLASWSFRFHTLRILDWTMQS